MPQLETLELERDPATGIPHIKGLYKHWRPNAGWQTEEQFSDGTLRLLGLLWVLLDGSGPLLLEEPELSLHAEVIRHIPQMMARLGRKNGRQMLVSTHSRNLLLDEGIAPEEVLVLEPSVEGTVVHSASGDPEIRSLLEEGSSMAEAVLPRTAPTGVNNSHCSERRKPIVSVFVTAAVEGLDDAAIVRRILEELHLELTRVHGQQGKHHIDKHIRGYNNAAIHSLWLVVRDLDQDETCAGTLVQNSFRVQHRSCGFESQCAKLKHGFWPMPFKWVSSWAYDRASFLPNRMHCRIRNKRSLISLVDRGGKL